MSNQYTGILWNKQKKRYDLYLWAGLVIFLFTYVLLQSIYRPEITLETLIIRASGLSAIILLHLILMIGPLSRINSKFLPLLYNRRHAGVSLFFLAAIHGIFCIIQFHALGDTSPLVSIFTSNQKYNQISQFPFQTLGFFALVILFLMAATSHDFWLKNLSPRIWKGLHMSVYVAYGLIIAHVATGAFQYETHPVNWVLLIGGFIVLSALHLYAGWMEFYRLSQEKKGLEKEGFYPICELQSITESRAKTCLINGENIAIFKYNNQLSAIHNQCKHQMGPLGEGTVIDGCVTCPWHGYQYLPENGQSPPPFTEQVKTYNLRLVKNTIWVDPKSPGEGVYIEPVKIPGK